MAEPDHPLRVTDPIKTNWLLVLTLFVAGLFAAAQFGKLTLTLAETQQVYAENALLVPFLVSIVGVVGILFGAVAGALVTRVGVTRALTGALVLGGALSIVQSLLPPIGAFAALRVIEGFSHLAIVVASPTLLAAISSDRDLPLVMGIWASFFGTSFALIALILPSLLAWDGLGAVFLAHGIGMICIAALLFPLLPKIRITEAVKLSYISEHVLIYTTPRLLLPGAGFVWYTLLYIALLAVLPVILKLPLWSVSVMPLISLAGTFGAGFLARTYAPTHIAIVGFALSALCTVVIMVTAQPIIAVLVLMLVMGLVPGACFAAIPHFNDTGTDRARATGGIAQFGNIGTTLGTPIFVYASYLGGIWAIGLGVIAFCIIGIACILMLGRRIAPV